MSSAITEDLIIKKLKQKHGLSEDGARWLLARLQKSLALDIIDVDTGLPVALIDDEVIGNDDVPGGNETAGSARG